MKQTDATLALDDDAVQVRALLLRATLMRARPPARPPARQLPRQVMQDVADDFVENVAAFACELAKHRAGAVLEAKDVQLALEKNWNLRLAGLGGGEEIKVIKKSSVTAVHKERREQVKAHKGEAARAAQHHK